MESIYNLVPKEHSVARKDPMYQSKWDPDQVYPGSTFGCSGNSRLVGAGKLTKTSSSSFGPQKNVKLLSNRPQNVKSSPKQATCYQHRLPSVPMRDETPIFGLKNSKNFVTANAVEAILQVPRQAKQEPNYLQKEDYGKVPSYLQVIKEEIERENDMIKSYVEKKVDQEPEYFEELSEQERSQLLRALKLKWEKTNSLYQKFTHLVSLDTIGKIRRKEMLETELKTIENDIYSLERSKNILIR